MAFIHFIHSSPSFEAEHKTRFQEMNGGKAQFLGVVLGNVAILQRNWCESGKNVSRLLRPSPSFNNNEHQQQRVDFVCSHVGSTNGRIRLPVKAGQVAQFGSFDPEVSSTVPVNVAP